MKNKLALCQSTNCLQQQLDSLQPMVCSLGHLETSFRSSNTTGTLVMVQQGAQPCMVLQEHSSQPCSNQY